jgi:glycogen(starch) synthase
MRVLMLGWELSPLISGGLGPACHGIFQALRREGIDVLFVVPYTVKAEGHLLENVIGALSNSQIIDRSGYSLPYTSSYSGGLYGKNIIAEVVRFAERVREITKEQSFDIIHAHDWTTCKAGILLQNALQKPLLLHIHSIEHDRSPASPSPWICALEKEGLLAADSVIAVSRYTRRRICENYQIAPNKVRVVHNGIDEDTHPVTRLSPNRQRPKTVLFVGRLTAQKGPQYFLLAAEKVLKQAPDNRFLVVGDGNERNYLEGLARELNITDKVLFTGFLSPAELDRVYSLASVCVITSVSEPFGLVALEAMKHGIPVIVSRQAGVTEVVQNCLRIDYWDIDSIASAILAVINNHDSLADELSRKATQEIRKLTWKKAAKKLVTVYRELTA